MLKLGGVGGFVNPSADSSKGFGLPTGFGNTATTPGGFVNNSVTGALGQTNTGFGNTTGFNNTNSVGFGNTTSTGFGGGGWGTKTSTGFGNTGFATTQNKTAFAGHTMFDPRQRVNQVLTLIHPNSPNHCLRHIFYNKKQAQNQRYTKPPNIPDALWAQAIAGNPDPVRKVPVFATGFGDLQTRIRQQGALIELQAKNINTMELGLAQRSNRNSTHRLDTILNKHKELELRVMNVMQRIQVLRGRGLSLSEQEHSWIYNLRVIENQLNAPNEMRARLTEVQAITKLNEKFPVRYASLPETSVGEIRQTLKMKQGEITHLMQFLRTASKNLNILTTDAKRL